MILIFIKNQIFQLIFFIIKFKLFTNHILYILISRFILKKWIKKDYKFRKLNYLIFCYVSRFIANCTSSMIIILIILIDKLLRNINFIR